jgi:hypothetical protein
MFLPQKKKRKKKTPQFTEKKVTEGNVKTLG